MNINSTLVQLIHLELGALAYTVFIKINFSVSGVTSLSIYLSILNSARKVISGCSVPLTFGSLELKVK